MSRYRGPRVKILRRFKDTLLPGLTSKQSNKKSSNNSVQKKKTNTKKSEYRIRLEEKQKLRFHYGVTERQLLRYVRIARRAKRSTGQVLLQLLEMRLDNIVFRLGLAPTIPAARQLVNHGHVMVNDGIVDIVSYRCKPQDTIMIKDNPRSRALVDKNLIEKKRTKLPSHLSFNSTSYIGSINQLVNRKSIGLKLKELLVVEYYSRQG